MGIVYQMPLASYFYYASPVWSWKVFLPRPRDLSLPLYNGVWTQSGPNSRPLPMADGLILGITQKQAFKRKILDFILKDLNSIMLG